MFGQIIHWPITSSVLVFSPFLFAKLKPKCKFWNISALQNANFGKLTIITDQPFGGGYGFYLFAINAYRGGIAGHHY